MFFCKCKSILRTGQFYIIIMFFILFFIFTRYLFIRECKPVYIMFLQFLMMFVFYCGFLMCGMKKILITDVSTEKLSTLIKNQFDLIHKIQLELNKIDMLKRILDRCPIMVVKWKNNQNTLPIVEVFGGADFLGYTEQELKKSNYVDLIHKKDKRRIVKEVLQGVKHKHTHWTQHYRLKTKKNKYVLVFSDVNVVLNKDNKIDYFEGVIIESSICQKFVFDNSQINL